MSVESWILDQDEDHPDSIFGSSGFISRLSAIFQLYAARGNNFRQNNFRKFFSWKQSWFENSIEPLLFHEFTFKNESEDFFSRDLTQDWPTIRIWITWTTNRLLPMLRISVFWEEEEWIRRTAAVYINAWLLMRQYLVFCNVII